METLINPGMRWAVKPSDQGSIEQIDGLHDATNTVPHEGDIITRPFLVDPTTKQPVPVRVVQIQTIHEKQRDILAVVVTRAAQLK